MNTVASTSAELARVAAERDDLEARLNAAHEALAIDEFSQDSCTTLESTIRYAVGRYRAVCDSEAEAADRIRQLTLELAQARGEG